MRSIIFFNKIIESQYHNKLFNYRRDDEFVIDQSQQLIAVTLICQLSSIFG